MVTLRSKIAIFLIVVFLLAPVDAELGTRKPNRLSILSIMSYTGNEPRDGKLCQASQEMVVRIVNNRSDILPDYHIELDFRNEGPAGMLATKVAIEFSRQMEERNDLFQSPVNMGPLLASGCKSWAMTASFMNMVAVTGSCTAPSLTANRKMSPNMYRVRCGADLALYGRMHYLKTMTNWRRIAILMYLSLNPFNFETATLFYKIAIQFGYEVAAFEATPDFNDDTMAALKWADIRIFTVEAAESIGAIRFLCQAYRAGITGPKYVFIFQFANYVNPNTLDEVLPYPFCTRAIIVEQSKYSLYIGTGYEALGRDPNSRTSLGHTLAEFEVIYNSFINKTRTPDYDYRHTCYDRTLQTVLILDQTEKALKSRNLSLRDYHNFPEQVMKVANKSSSEIDFMNLRHGRFHYSSRVEFDYEAQQVTMWSNETGLQLLARVICHENSSSTNISSYYTQQLLPLPIVLPRDEAIHQNVTVEVPISVFGIAAALACVLVLGEVAILYFPFLSSPISKRFFVIAAIFLDIAAVAFATPRELTNTCTCTLAAISTTLGLALLHSTLSFVLLATYMKIPRISSSVMGLGAVRTQTNTADNRSFFLEMVPIKRKVHPSASLRSLRSGRPPTPVMVEMPPLQPLQLNDSYIASGAFLYTLINLFILIALLVSNPLAAKAGIFSQAAIYYEERDTYVTKWAVACEGNDMDEWIMTMFCLNLIPSFIGLYASFKLGYNRALSQFPEVKLQKFALQSETILYLAIFATMFIVSTSLVRQLIASFALLFCSAWVICVVFFNSVREKINPTSENSNPTD